jgi:hypothetical protein
MDFSRKLKPGEEESVHTTLNGVIGRIARCDRPISIGSSQHKEIFHGLGLDIRMFESRQRKLLQNEKYGDGILNGVRHSNKDLRPYIAQLPEYFTDLTVGDLIRIANFINTNFEMLEKNKNVFIELLKNEFPELNSASK